jgi:two-component system, NarL family, nitrate/nitrite response regulator NarL
MKLMLCVANNSVEKRWLAALSNHYELQTTSSLSEMTVAIREQEIELVLLHRSIIDMKTLSEIRDLTPSCKFFIFSDRPKEDEGLVFIQTGAIGYANAYITSTRLLEAVRMTLSGRVWVGQRLMQKIILGSVSKDQKTEEQAPQFNLSPRELEVAKLVSLGLSNSAIGEQLYISERTVKAHISTIFKKTETSSRLQLALKMQKQTK